MWSHFSTAGAAPAGWRDPTISKTIRPRLSGTRPSFVISKACLTALTTAFLMCWTVQPHPLPHTHPFATKQIRVDSGFLSADRAVTSGTVTCWKVWLSAFQKSSAALWNRDTA